MRFIEYLRAIVSDGSPGMRSALSALDRLPSPNFRFS
jgi:hypothetical protein